MKTRLRLLLPIVLSVGLLIVVMATQSGTARAHQTTVTCTDRATSTWTIINSEAERAMTFTSPQGPSGSIAAGGSTTVVYNGSVLTIDGFWPSDQFTHSDTGNGDCFPEVIDTTTSTSTSSSTSQPPTTPTASVTADCQGIHVTATGYTGTGNNQLSIDIEDEIPIEILFPPLNTTTFPVPQDGQVHAWSVTINANISAGAGNTVGDFFSEGEVGPCGGVLTPILEVEPFAFCGDDNLPVIEITFGTRPDLDGQQGVLSFSTGGSVPLVFQSNTTVTIPYPNTTQNVNLIYSLGQETETGSVTYPENCPPVTTTTPTTVATTPPPTGVTTSTPTTTVAPTTTVTGATTTTVAPTTLPPTFTFAGATTVCVSEVPTIQITFQNQFPSLAGQTGTLSMTSVTNGVFLGSQPLVYTPGSTVSILYPGTKVNADGSIADVPGWNLNSSGFWVRDQTDEFLRDGIVLTYTVNPTATATVTYPPESSACANPSGPFGPAPAPPVPVGTLPHTL